MHNCSLDDKIRISLGCCSFLSLSLSAYESAILIVIFFLWSVLTEAQVVEQAVEVAASKKKSGKNNNNNGEGAKKGKRPPTAFFLFM